MVEEDDGAEAGWAGGAGMRFWARSGKAQASAPTNIVMTALKVPRAILFASRGI